MSNRESEKILYWNTLEKVVRKNGDITIDKYCNGVEIVNIGADVVTVNQRPLNPPAAGEVLGDSYTKGGNRAEIFVGRITLAFQTVVNPAVLVTQKVYLPDTNKGCEL